MGATDGPRDGPRFQPRASRRSPALDHPWGPTRGEGERLRSANPFIPLSPAALRPTRAANPRSRVAEAAGPGGGAGAVEADRAEGGSAARRLSKRGGGRPGGSQDGRTTGPVETGGQATGCTGRGGGAGGGGGGGGAAPGRRLPGAERSGRHGAKLPPAGDPAVGPGQGRARATLQAGGSRGVGALRLMQ